MPYLAVFYRLRRPLLLLTLLALLLPAWRPSPATAASVPLPRAAPAPVVPAATATQAELPVVGQLGGITYTLATSGTLVFQSEGANVTVWDMADPFAPNRVSSLLMGGVITTIQRRGSLLYVGHDTRGLSIVDASDPRALVLRRRIDVYGTVGGLKLYGGRAYVSSTRPAGSRLQIFSLANRTRPVLIGQQALDGRVYGLDVVDGVAYIAGWDRGVHIVDVSTPAQPRRVGGFLTGIRWFNDERAVAQDVQIVNQRAYVAWGSGGLRIFDVSSPLSPRPLSRLRLPGHTWDVEIVGGRAYLATYQGGLHIVKLGQVPVLLGTASLTWANRVKVVGQRAYVADLRQGLLVYALDRGPVPVLLARAPGLSDANDIALVGRYAYIVGIEFLVAVDMLDPAKPTISGSLNLPPSEDEDPVLEVVGEVGYIAQQHALHIVDLRDPASLHISATMVLTDSVMDLRVVNGLAYLAYRHRVSMEWGGLYIVDVTDPGAPVLSGEIGALGGGETVDVLGNFAYLTTLTGKLEIIDVSNPDAPHARAPYPTDNWLYFQIVGSRAYGFNYVGDGRVLDLTVPEQPTELASLSLTVGNAIGAIYGDGAHLYLGGGPGGLAIYDLHALSSPVRTGAFNTPGFVMDVFPSGDLIYVADSVGGLFILRNTSAQ